MQSSFTVSCDTFTLGQTDGDGAASIDDDLAGEPICSLKPNGNYNSPALCFSEQ